MKRFDRAYFDRWYRDPRHRVISPSSMRRKLMMVVAIAEYMLQRPIRSLLDVGCGEGQWGVALASMRPRARYQGVDPSEYAVRRYGRRRNIRLGSLADLEELGLRGRFDVVVSSGVLNYLDDDELRRGLTSVRRLTRAVSFLEIFTDRDRIEGDTRGWRRRPRGYYRRLMRRLGFVQCGPHCWLPDDFEEAVAELETA